MSGAWLAWRQCFRNTVLAGVSFSFSTIFASEICELEIESCNGWWKFAGRTPCKIPSNSSVLQSLNRESKFGLYLERFVPHWEASCMHCALMVKILYNSSKEKKLHIRAGTYLLSWTGINFNHIANHNKLYCSLFFSQSWPITPPIRALALEIVVHLCGHFPSETSQMSVHNYTFYVW